MACIAYLLLCHTAPERVVAQARALVAAGDAVAIHADARMPQADFARIKSALGDEARVVLAPRRRCAWGGWSLVGATLDALRAALAAFPEASHFYLISGDCLPIKPAAQIRAQLADQPRDHIETVDFFRSDWIKVGLREERLTYRHLFNERTHKRLFYASLEVQKRLGLARPLPAGLDIRIGSQWWCLRRSTAEAILALLARRRDILRFFRTTWIPDETFFQTLVHHLVPSSEITGRPPTFLAFTDYGLPVVFTNDQAALLLSQPEFFARKISPEARTLQERLWQVHAGTAPAPEVAGRGRRALAYLAGRGRIGARFAPRAWERGSRGEARWALSVIACKKWHVGKRLSARLGRLGTHSAYGYIFDDPGAKLPDLGGIGAPAWKRWRHRRALLRLLFEASGTARLVICLDPCHLDILRDLASDDTRLRILDVACTFTPDDVAAHARRAGLADKHTPPAILEALVPTITREIEDERTALLGAGFATLSTIEQGAPTVENAIALAEGLGIAYHEAHEIVSAGDLFAD